MGNHWIYRPYAHTAEFVVFQGIVLIILFFSTPLASNALQLLNHAAQRKEREENHIHGLLQCMRHNQVLQIPEGITSKSPGHLEFHYGSYKQAFSKKDEVGGEGVFYLSTEKR